MAKPYSLITVKFEDPSFPDVTITDRKVSSVSQLNNHIINMVRGMTRINNVQIDTNSKEGYRVNIIGGSELTLVAVIEYTSALEQFLVVFDDSPMFKAGYFCYKHDRASFFIDGSREFAMRFPSKKNAIAVLDSFGISESFYNIEVIEV